MTELEKVVRRLARRHNGVRTELGYAMEAVRQEKEAELRRKIKNFRA